MKNTSKINFLFWSIFMLSSIAFGQKKLEYELRLGIFAGMNAEFLNESFNNNITNSSFSSSLDEKPSILAGISVSTPFNPRGWQFKTGLDIHRFQYTFFTSSFGPRTFFNTTITRNTVVQLPLGYCKRWNDFLLYIGSGLTFFTPQDLSTEKEIAGFDASHIGFVKNTLSNFKTVYPFYEISIGWWWQRSSIELGYRRSGTPIKKEFNNSFYRGSRGILYIGTSLLLYPKIKSTSLR